MLTARSLVYKWLINYLGFLFFILLTGLLASLMTILLSLVIAQCYTMLFGLTSSRSQFLMDMLAFSNQLSFISWLWILAGGILGKMILDFLFNSCKGVLSEKITMDLRKDLFHHQLNLHPKWYQEKGSDRYLLRFSGDLSSVQNFMSRGILQFISDLTLLVTGLSFICYFNLMLVGVIFLFVSIIGIIVLVINQNIGFIESQRRNRKARLLAMVAQTLRGLNTLKMFNQQKIYHHRFSKKATSLYTLGIKYQFRRASLNALIVGGGYALLVLVLLTVHWVQYSQEQVDSTYLFAIVIILLSWRPSINRLLKVGLIWKKGMISLNKLASLLNKSQENQPERPFLKLKGNAIYIKAVSYEYNTVKILPPFSLWGQQGTLSLIEGPPSSGKSTLVKLITGFLTPSTGSIFIDDHCTKELDPIAVRRVISIHACYFPLIGKTVGEAITRSNSEKQQTKAFDLLVSWSTDFEMLQSIEMDTLISTLSENQKNLLMWIRLIVRDCPIWLLDEPFPNAGQNIRQKIWSRVRPYTLDRVVLLFTTELEHSLKNQLNYTEVIKLGKNRLALF